MSMQLASQLEPTPKRDKIKSTRSHIAASSAGPHWDELSRNGSTLHSALPKSEALQYIHRHTQLFKSLFAMDAFSRSSPQHYSSTAF